jgi:predicted O-methyltransferase YrrM
VNIPGLPALNVDEYYWVMNVIYREGYVLSKYTIAKKYQPKRICEIGVHAGISALCFLAASPSAEYVGIDIQPDGVVEQTREKLISLGYNSKIIITDSQKLTELPEPPYDFIHVDGDHTPEGAYHDTAIAWKALTYDGVLLVDDCHNMQVVRGVTAAIHDAPTDLVDWSYDDDGVGTMVVQRRPRGR